MAKFKFSTTPSSVVLRIKILDKSAIDGSGLTGLTFNSAGLIIALAKIGEATTTAYTQAGGNIETIATLGTYAAPTGGKCRFKEYDSVNHKGVYELQFADARFTSTTQILGSILGATNCAETELEIQIESITVTTLSASAINAIADQVWDEILTGATHNIATSAGRRLRQIEAPSVIRTGTAQAGSTASTIKLDAGASAVTDFYKHTFVSIVGGTGIGQSRLIEAYNGTSKVADIVDNWAVTPDATSEFSVNSYGIVHAHEVDGVNDKTGYTATADNMRGTDNAALAASALNKAVWTAAKAAFLDAAITGRATPAQVKTQAKEVIFNDTITELTAGLLAKNPTPAAALMALYMKLRNIFKSGDAEQAAQVWEIYNDNGDVISTGPLTSAGSIFTKGKAVAP